MRLEQARILVVDDGPANVDLLEHFLSTAGYAHVRGTTDSRVVTDIVRTWQPDLVLLDLLMPHVDGFAVLEELRTLVLPGVYLPVIAMTGDGSVVTRRRALDRGATDFVTKPFDRIEVLLRIRNALQTRALYLALEHEKRGLEQTVRERTERLVQNEKLATLGSLLAGLAHELNNPLTVVSGQARLLQETASDPDAARRARRIGEAAERSVQIVRNFLALARQQPAERIEVSLNDVVAGAVDLLAFDLRGARIRVTMDLARHLPAVAADPHQLHQVVVNLVTNAQQALRRHDGERAIRIATGPMPERNRVWLTVSDTGPGIPRELHERIFEPFFTTKPSGEGTGLGLALCRSVVETHGGTITVDSEPAGGTTFAIELPVAPAVPLPRRAPAAAAPASGPAAILIVDDEPDVAATLAEALARDGHAVSVADDGAQAFEMLEERRYDLVVSDTNMPALDGERFYEQLVSRFPALRSRVIFVTADVLSPERRAFHERAGVPVVAKPCDLEDVRRLVRRMVTAA